jgi:hypothetical protein
VDSSAAIVPTIANPSGTVPPASQVTVWLTVTVNEPLGIHTGELTINASPGTIGVPQTVPLEVRVVPEVQRTYLPTMTSP